MARRESARCGRKPTSYEVARAAGVSQITVSRVFNPEWTDRVKQETREKVLEAAKELGYNRNAIASGLASQRTNLIAFVTNDTYNSFYMELLTEITNILSRYGKRVMLFNTAVDSDINVILHRLEEYSVDGIILSASSLTNQITTEVIENSPPLVLLNLGFDNLDCNYVYVDNYEASRQVAKYLLGTGHRRYCMLTSANSVFRIHVKRMTGFIAGLAESGTYDCRILPADYTYVSGQQAAREIYNSDFRPDAVYCPNDWVAMGFMDAARTEFGVSIPEDVSVVGFDDNEIASFEAYNLTTVRQDKRQIAEKTAQLLLEKMRDPGRKTEHILIPGELVIRASTMDRNQKS